MHLLQHVYDLMRLRNAFVCHLHASVSIIRNVVKLHTTCWRYDALSYSIWGKQVGNFIKRQVRKL